MSYDPFETATHSVFLNLQIHKNVIIQESLEIKPENAPGTSTAKGKREAWLPGEEEG